MWSKSLYISHCGELSLFVESRIQCVVLAYFDRKKYNFLPFMLIKCLVQTLQCAETPICICFAHENMKAPLSKIGCFSKIVEIFSLLVGQKPAKISNYAS